MRPGARILLAALGLAPLLAPYEWMMRASWEDYLNPFFNPFFVVAALVSAGAIAVSESCNACRCMAWNRRRV